MLSVNTLIALPCVFLTAMLTWCHVFDTLPTARFCASGILFSFSLQILFMGGGVQFVSAALLRILEAFLLYAVRGSCGRIQTHHTLVADM